MKKLFLLSIIGLLAGSVIAQTAKKDKLQYAGFVNVGLAGGSSEINYTAQTIHGLQKKNWFAGVGFGIDNYGIPGFPLMAHVQKSFTQSYVRPFVYGQAGIQLPWKKDEWDVKSWDNTRDLYDLKNGFVGELGIGCQFKVGRAKRHAFTVSAAYSYKHNKAEYSRLQWALYLSSLPPPDYNTYSTEYQDYRYRRIVVRTGFWF